MEGLTPEERHAIQIATAAAAGAKAAAAARAEAAAKAQAMVAALEAEGLADANAGPATQDAELARALLGVPADAALPATAAWQAPKVTPQEWEKWDSMAKEYGDEDEEDLDGIHGSGADRDMWNEMTGEGSSGWSATKALAHAQAKAAGPSRVGKEKGKGKGKEEGRPPPSKTGDSWELSRFDTGLQLLNEMSPESAKWQYVLHDESRRSFASYLPEAFSQEQCQAFFPAGEGRHGLETTRESSRCGPPEGCLVDDEGLLVHIPLWGHHGRAASVSALHDRTASSCNADLWDYFGTGLAGCL